MKTQRKPNQSGRKFFQELEEFKYARERLEGSYAEQRQAIEDGFNDELIALNRRYRIKQYNQCVRELTTRHDTKKEILDEKKQKDLEQLALIESKKEKQIIDLFIRHPGSYDFEHANKVVYYDYEGWRKNRQDGNYGEEIAYAKRVINSLRAENKLGVELKLTLAEGFARKRLKEVDCICRNAPKYVNRLRNENKKRELNRIIELATKARKEFLDLIKEIKEEQRQEDDRVSIVFKPNYISEENR